MHGDDPDQTHRLYLFVRELLTDQAGYLCVRLAELALVGFGADVASSPILALEEHTLEDSDLVGQACFAQVHNGKLLSFCAAKLLPHHQSHLVFWYQKSLL